MGARFRTLCLAVLFVMASWGVMVGSVAAVDTDMDGTEDMLDDCPWAAGNSTKDRLGCPDTDQDGTSDLNDPWASPVGGYAESGLNDTGRDITAVGLSPDGHLLAFGQDNGIARIYNTTTRTQVVYRQIGGSSNEDIGEIEFNPNGTWLAVGVNWADDEVRIVRTSDLGDVRTLDGNNGPNDDIVGLAWSPNGTYLALSIGARRQRSNVDGEIRVFNALNGSLVQTLDPLTSDDDYGGIVFSPDGTRMGVSGPGRAWFYNTNDWSWNGTIAIHTSGDQPRIDAIDWSPDGNHITLCERTDGGSQGARIGSWNATTFSLEWQRSNQFSTSCLTAKFSPDGTVIAAGLNNNGGDAGDIYHFTARTGSQIDISRGQDSRVMELVWLQDGGTIVSAHESRDGGGGGGERDGLVWWDFDLDGDHDGWNTTDMGDGRIDRFPSDGSQWNDTDNDGFGDNWANDTWNASRQPGGIGEWYENASAPDACPTTIGPSTADRYGCPDKDADGWSDPDAGWTVLKGADAFITDWWQHADADLDGAGDEFRLNGSTNGLYLQQSGDKFPANPTQWSDTDNDDHGDNFANVSWAARWTENEWPGIHVANATQLDAFPTLPEQWNDTDGDGWGDITLQIRGDWCIHDFGGSTEDRNGCLDTDGDGYSDPDANDSGNIGPSGDNVSDAFPVDPTQWSDYDADGYGDNATGTLADDCSGLWGNSTEDRLGCPDADGDGYSDIADPFDSEPTQWKDTDADGFGDNWDDPLWNASRTMSWPGVFLPYAWNPDQFPLDGTQSADTDGDGYGDDPNGNFGDIWPSDPTQWFDGDGDGFGDQLNGTLGDVCPLQAGTSTDPVSRGCPDRDDDGVVDREDPFPNNPLQSSDRDGDGYGDAQTTADGDDCPNDLGTSHNNSTYGCPDTDGDGWADQDDPFPLDPAQWLDTDGDGHGDYYSYVNETIHDPDRAGMTIILRKESGDKWPDDGARWSDRDGDDWTDQPGGLQPDIFPIRSTQWRDSDGDGYGDEFVFGSWQPDSCRLTHGSSVGVEAGGDRWGCPDGDGDGWSDEGDACPTDPDHHAVGDTCVEPIVDPPDTGQSDGEGTTIFGQDPLVVIAAVGVLVAALLGAVLVGMFARTAAARRSSRERVAAGEDMDTVERRLKWIQYYVAEGRLDEARGLGWDGVNPPPPRAETEPSWQQLAAEQGIVDPIASLPGMPPPQ